MAVPTNRRAILLATFIAFGGNILHLVSLASRKPGCLIMPDFAARFGQIGSDGQPYLSSSRQSIITSLLGVGTIVGAIAQAFTSDRFGRRGSVIIWSAVFTVGVAIQTATGRVLAQIVFGRFVAGLGVGALSAIVPLYNGETAPKALRGALIVLYQVNIFSGIFISDCIELGTQRLKGSPSWRIPIGLQMLWGLILLSGVFFLPESPWVTIHHNFSGVLALILCSSRHLLGIGKETEAQAVVAELNGVPQDDPLVQDIIEDLAFGIKAENEGGKVTWLECFSTRNQLWKRTINGMMLMFIQQLNGQNFYFYYGDTFFQTILGAVSVAGVIPALYLIDAWGRRRSLLIGALAQAACAIIAALVGHLLLAPTGTPANLLTARNRQGGDVLIAFAVIHVFAFSLFWGATPWRVFCVFTSEIELTGPHKGFM
ncbi:hypothetical protein POSPLADRAFT_1042397 [Postia placenta MAD-698-R-SB12]|uniref:Major facilitator superfamily (MFS) profile domain-containing protein n=1 Tax=Postia placenta MAD-698-R-SB12 TaxID=670580 RepID=A0A1X6NER9_9APHY|nr:hypothetical protein POSPLADRAFT_1042397 [Postia placenta MAD-698-R-SB12]OSX67129.1 hypothetical protein POSPLADRAFT_1042397 [Postia placenta MAD-698-R-SB12]